MKMKYNKDGIYLCSIHYTYDEIRNMTNTDLKYFIFGPG